MTDAAHVSGVIPQAADRRRVRWRLGFASTAVLLAAADTYVVVLALPAIMNDIGLGTNELQRAAPIVSGFLLGYVAVLPLLGRLSDVYGRVPVFIGCLGAFTVGSVVTATAGGLGAVVVGRTVQGLGGGGLVPVTLALVADGWSAGRRGLPLGLVGAVQELGSVLGPLYGAVIITVSSWRTIFWINLPISLGLGVAFAAARPLSGRVEPRRGRTDIVGAGLLVLAAGGAVLALASPSRLTDSDAWGGYWTPLLAPDRLIWFTPLVAATAGVALLFVAWELAAPGGSRPLVPLRRLPSLLTAADWVGALLLAGTLGCVIVAFAAADPTRQLVADDARVLLVIAAVLGLAFLVRERWARDPLIQASALRDRAAIGALLTNLAIGAALMAALVDVPIFARTTVDPNSQLEAALVLVRFLALVPVGALLGGAICERLTYRATAALGMGLAAAMFLLMSTWSVGALGDRVHGLAINPTDFELAACGLGFGLAIAPINAALLAAVRPSLHGLASALLVVARMVGMLVGLSALTALGLHELYAHFPDATRYCPRGAITCPAFDSAVTTAIVGELHTIFFGAALCAAVAAVLAAALLRTPRNAVTAAVGR